MPPEPKSPEEKSQPQATNQLKQIRTFQGDVADALAHQHESLYSLQAKEHARNGSPAAVAKSALPLLIGSMVLLAFAGVAGWLAYGEFVRKTTPPVPSTPDNRFFATEESTDINVQGLSGYAFFQAITEQPFGGETTHLVLKTGTSTASLLTTRDFFSAIDASAPGNLVRALEPLFMFGSYGDSYFLIFRITSYDNAFGGMLNWEKTMPRDLQPIFNATIPSTFNGSTSVFSDVVYKNKDIRALYGETDSEEGTTTAPILLYSFLGTKTLIITDRLEVLQTLIDRLTRDSLVR